MGIGCCNYNKKPKEIELILHKKIQYSIYEINKILNYNNNNENIMTNTNEQDKISTSSYGFERRNESLDSSSSVDNYQKNKIIINNSFLRQINEKEQKYEQDQDNNSYNHSFSENEKISVNHLINNVDKIFLNSINNNNVSNNIKKDELKNSKQIIPYNMENYNKMNHYNIESQMQWKIRGDINNDDINFENFDDNYNEENKTIEEINNNINNKNLNNNNNTELQNKNLDDINNENIEFYKIDINNMFNNDNRNSGCKSPNSPQSNKNLNSEQYHNYENNDFNRNHNFKDNNKKNSFNDIDTDNLDNLLIDDNNLITTKDNICHTKNINSGVKDNNKKNIFANDINGSNANSLSEIEKKDYFDSLYSISKDEIRTSLYHKKKIIKLPKEKNKKNI